uniref:ORF9 n=1 Tax=Lymantria dispar multicapsid nuclear polyhedrosis virus TaxID=10449 RepID=A0A513WW59_NPVLD|nr:ORF9 [Lymantria dispar multiple nucleopolyhedrovirus]
MRVNSLRSQRFLCIWVLDSEATFLQCKKSGSAPPVRLRACSIR